MNRRRGALVTSLVIGTLAAAAPCAAQVEKVAVRTTGISCGTCAAVSEIYLRRLAGVDAVKISLSNEAVMLAYRPGAAFQPKQIRDALGRTAVGIVQFQIRVRGRVEQRDCVRFLAAGGERFLLTTSPGATLPAAGATVMVEGTLIDRANPMVLAVRSITAAP
jgi:copper chaperone CopZ